MCRGLSSTKSDAAGSGSGLLRRPQPSAIPTFGLDLGGHRTRRCVDLVSSLPTALASVVWPKRRLHCGSFLQTGDYVDRVFYGFLLAQVEVRRLAMSKCPSSTLCSIVRGFPIRMAQELAYALEFGRCHSLLNTPELRHSLVGRVGPPGFIQGSCFC